MLLTKRVVDFITVLVIVLCLYGCSTTTGNPKIRIPDASSISSDIVKSGKLSNELAFLTASEFAEMIRSRQVTSLQVVDALLSRIARHNSTLKAIVTLDVDKVRQRAKEADAALDRGENWGPLHGVPVTIKDNLATTGIRTTSSYKLTENHIPDFDAPVVERLKKAGAIILGKTNMPLLGLDYQANSPIFGISNNPWDVTRTTGGSTGGGAAAVAAGLSPLEIGNDLGGSVRIPAAFCGVYGIKPTERLVSTSGINPGLPKRDSKSIRYLLANGPLARSIADLKLALSIILGPDAKDPNIPDVKLSDQKKSLKNLRIAWSDDFGGVPVTEDTRTALANLAVALTDAGCHVENVNPPEFDFLSAWNTYGELIDFRFGVYTPLFARVLMCMNNWSNAKEVPMQKMVCPMSYEKFLRALTKREEFMVSMDNFLSNYDVFLAPVHVTTAYKHIAPDNYFGPFAIYDTPVMVNNEPVNYWVANASYAAIFNLTGNPVVSMPIAYDKDGLPIGIQVVGKRWHDLDLLNNVAEIDKVSNAFKHPPGFE